MNKTKSVLIATVLCAFGATAFAQAPQGAGPRGNAHPKVTHHAKSKLHLPHWHHAKQAHHVKHSAPQGK